MIIEPSDAYIPQQLRASMVQIMACSLLGPKHLSEPMLVCSQFDHWEPSSVKF